MADWPASGDPNRVIISPYSPQAMGAEYAAAAAATPSSVAWGTINLIRLYPFVLSEPVLMRKLWIYKGATVTGSVDVGIYAEDDANTCVRLASAGATAVAASANILQEFDITDIQLGRGRYYMAAAMSLTTTTMFSNAFVANTAKLFGWAEGGTAGSTTLPATITLATCTTAVQPLFGCASRTLVA